MACARVPSLDVDQAAGSLAQVLHQSGSGPLHAREVLGAVALTSANAALLDAKPGQPAFRLEREVFDEQGRCWEYGLRAMCGHDLRFDILTAEKDDDPFCYYFLRCRQRLPEAQDASLELRFCCKPNENKLPSYLP